MQHNDKDIFERERSGEIISLRRPEYGKIADLITEAQALTGTSASFAFTPR